MKKDTSRTRLFALLKVAVSSVLVFGTTVFFAEDSGSQRFPKNQGSFEKVCRSVVRYDFLRIFRASIV